MVCASEANRHERLGGPAPFVGKLQRTAGRVSAGLCKR